MMKVQLKPAHLGEVFMKISVDGGRVMAKVVTESLMAKDAIETQLYQLRESLATQGIKIDKFSVFVGDKWQEHQSHAGYDQQPSGNGRRGYQQQNEFNPFPAEVAAGQVYPGYESQSTTQINFVA